MKKFPFLRRPVRLILYTVLLALVTTAALIFAWQYQLDGIVLDYSIDTYAYVGTIVRADGEILDGDTDRDLASLYGVEPPEMGGPAFLEEIPAELVQWLNDSEHVARIDDRQTLAALVGEHTRVQADITEQTVKVPDSMMKDANVQPYHFLEGTVNQVQCWSDPSEEIQLDDVLVKVDKMWSDPAFAQDLMLVDMLRHNSEAPLEVGQRVFLIGMYIYSANSGLSSSQRTMLYTPKATQANRGEDYTLSLVERYSITVIPEGVDSESYIQEYLGSTGLGDYLKNLTQSQYAVTVRKTQDMMMIPLFAQGKARTYEGRMLTSSDIGKKVCVISNGLAQRNRLTPGDTIRLAVADGCYTIQSDEYNNGWETGEPGGDDALLEYGAYEEYEIVGIYTQAGRREKNALYFPYGDIFIPAQEDTAAQTVRPYTFSFRVPGPGYVDFLAEFEPVLEEYGYSLVIEDTGWDDVKESFYTMQTRRQLMLLCAAAAFAAAVAVFAVLLSAHCRYEYGLRRLMGASKREAVGIYGATFLFTGLPGGLAAVGAAWFAAVRLMKGAMTGDTMIPLPTDGQCALTLAAWAALELAAALAVLLALALRGERRGLLRLIRR